MTLKQLLPFLAAVVVLWPSVARAQPAEPFEVTDNSFFVEEAFNQEAGIFQNIFGWVRHRGGSWERAHLARFAVLAHDRGAQMFVVERPCLVECEQRRVQDGVAA